MPAFEKSRGPYIDKLTDRRRWRDGLATLSQSLYMKLNRLFDECQNFLSGFANRDATREIWHMGAIT